MQVKMSTKPGGTMQVLQADDLVAEITFTAPATVTYIDPKLCLHDSTVKVIEAIHLAAQVEIGEIS